MWALCRYARLWLELPVQPALGGADAEPARSHVAQVGFLGAELPLLPALQHSCARSDSFQLLPDCLDDAEAMPLSACDCTAPGAAANDSNAAFHHYWQFILPTTAMTSVSFVNLTIVIRDVCFGALRSSMHCCLVSQVICCCRPRCLVVDARRVRVRFASP